MLLKAQALGVHAFVVGIGFFAIGLPVALLVSRNPEAWDVLRSAAEGSPEPLVIGFLAVGAYYALPLLWPLHMMLGLYEARLVGRIGRGDLPARRAARRVLSLQAMPFACLALVLAAWFEFTWWSPSLVPLAWAGAHLLLGRWLGTPDHAQGDCGGS